MGAADSIGDFAQGQDKINLLAIDARSATTSNETFRFIGEQAFTGNAGEVHAVLFDQSGTANDYTPIQGDVNGDRVADFEIMLHGQLIHLQASDFVL